MFDGERANARMHRTFGHGVHRCAGAHLARAEGRVTLERLVDHTSHIAIDDDVHGPAGDRTYRFLPTYFLRGLAQLGVTVAAA